MTTKITIRHRQKVQGYVCKLMCVCVSSRLDPGLPEEEILQRKCFTIPNVLRTSNICLYGKNIKSEAGPPRVIDSTHHPAPLSQGHLCEISDSHGGDYEI
jgi:hypothetical protein